jgi:TolB-like protein/Tfp pilus assembly protein PilF
LLYFFDDCALDTDRCELRRSGELLSVEPKVFDLLTYLVDHRDRVVSKDDLIAGVWMGRVVSDSALTTCINAARAAIGDSGETQRLIKTLPRKGIRFVATVREGDSPAREPRVAPDASLPQKPSLAVLPFVNLSNDPNQEYFADGLTEDIITGLSRLRWLLVTASDSSFKYKVSGVDAKQVGHELSVGYVLKGTVRRSSQRVRITAQLIDASTDMQVWAERYDGDLAEFFALQDQITENVVASIEPHIFAAEGFRSQRKTPASLDAWGLVMRALPHIWTWASNDNETALAYLKRATEIDPGYARANSLIAWAYAARLHTGWAVVGDSLDLALTFARLAVEQDGEDPWGHLALGWVHANSRRFRPAVEEITAAIELNPSSAFAQAMLGMAYGYGGRADEGLQQLSLALRLSPRDPQQARYLATNGFCHLMAKRFPVAVGFLRRSVQLRPHFLAAWKSLAAAAGLAGDLETATSALAEVKRVQPDLSIDWIERYHPIVHEKDRAMYIEGLRAAGLE